MHAFVYAVLTLAVLVRWLPAIAVLGGLLTAHVWAAMKRVCGQGWLVTTLKAGVLGTD